HPAVVLKPSALSLLACSSHPSARERTCRVRRDRQSVRVPSVHRCLHAPHYGVALLAWNRHVVDTRRQATTWRFAAAATMALCIPSPVPCRFEQGAQDAQASLVQVGSIDCLVLIAEPEWMPSIETLLAVVLQPAGDYSMWVLSARACVARLMDGACTEC